MYLFIFNSILLGVGLAMDAFSVSLANGLNDPQMKSRRMTLISGTYCFFQFAMPMIGWICVHTIVEYFQSFEKFIPWIALILLAYIGGSMIKEGIHPDDVSQESEKKLTFSLLLIQGIATSIDALSVGFTISEYSIGYALLSSAIIGIVTFLICLGGLEIGKKFGTKLAGKASIIGGCILIFLGLEIFIRGILGI